MSALARVLQHGEEGAPGAAMRFVAELAVAGVPFVVVGAVAATYHGKASDAESLDLTADLSTRQARALSQTLNRLGALPRGVHVREGFAFDASLVRSAPSLALRHEGIAVNIGRSFTEIGEYPQVREVSELVADDHLSYRVLTRAGLDRAAAGLARHSGAG
jgi:hypothetical protein